MSEKFFLGKKEFVAGKETYPPKEDYFLLLECLAEELKENKELETALDLGCGTGVQGLFLAEEELKVVCVDINPKVLENAKENFRRAGLKAEFKASNLFSRIEGRFDLIAFNPPYLISEEIKYAELIIIKYIIQYIEQSFPGQVCGRSQFQACRWLYKPAFMTAAYYAQLTILKRLQYWCVPISSNI